jgi:hypothetical protein
MSVSSKAVRMGDAMFLSFLLSIDLHIVLREPVYLAAILYEYQMIE